MMSVASLYILTRNGVCWAGIQMFFNHIYLQFNNCADSVQDVCLLVVQVYFHMYLLDLFQEEDIRVITYILKVSPEVFLCHRL